MPKFLTAKEAVELIKDGDTLWSNSFLACANPANLQTALGERFLETGHPKNLTFCCSVGAGDFTKGSANEEFVRAGAVSAVVLGHYSSMPDTSQMVLDGKIEGYNLPLGVMSKMVRAAAGGETYFISDIGLNLFVDPIYGQSKLNDRSKKDYVTDIVIDGKRRLKYEIPNMDVAFIKGTSADKIGNISFEKEAGVGDALSLAQAVKIRGGTVIVQVERMIEGHQRPWNVIVPSSLVDYIAVCPEQTQIAGVDEFVPAYAGDEFYDADTIQAMILKGESEKGEQDPSRSIIGRRAVQEMKAGDFVNIGIGIPENVAVEAAKSGLLKEVTLTVESGAMKGVPASGVRFGAALSPHSIYNMAQQFDFYDGRGLNVCFLGALEIDGDGNVNAHMNAGKLSGIGGFANITQSTPKVIFCGTFTAGGLQVTEENGTLTINKEGKHAKFMKEVTSISFSAKNARLTGQEVLYVTERCVFRLGEKGLILTEVFPGIDKQRDILDQLPFEVTVDC